MHSSIVVGLCIATSAAQQQRVMNQQQQHSKTPIDPQTIRCGSGSNTQPCPAGYICTAPDDCAFFKDGVYYESCVGVCVPDRRDEL